MKKYFAIITLFAVFFGFTTVNTTKAANSPFATLLKKPVSSTISKTIKPISGTIRGLVRGIDGKPLKSATITVYKKMTDSSFVFYARTESDGGPKGGKYEVKIDSKGVYKIVPSYVSINPVNVTFKPKQTIVQVFNAKPVESDFRMKLSN